jgi:hypothetical protein
MSCMKAAEGIQDRNFITMDCVEAEARVLKKPCKSTKFHFDTRDRGFHK